MLQTALINAGKVQKAEHQLLHVLHQRTYGFAQLATAHSLPVRNLQRRVQTSPPGRREGATQGKTEYPTTKTAQTVQNRPQSQQTQESRVSGPGRNAGRALHNAFYRRAQDVQNPYARTQGHTACILKPDFPFQGTVQLL